MRFISFDVKLMEEAVLKLLDNAPLPVSIEFVAKKLGISWVTARGLLLSLALKGRIKALKTSKFWVFMSNEHFKRTLKILEGQES